MDRVEPRRVIRCALLALLLPITTAGDDELSVRGSAGAAEGVPGVEVRYPVSDTLTLHADVHRSALGASAPVVLLFHQGGGDARGEYSEITPRLLAEGYHVVATDTRGGGDRFGGENRAGPLPEGASYCDVLAEVDAAIDLARAEGLSGPVVLWGSSYTAALALHVAVRRAPEVAAVLAFSPAWGEPMAGCDPLDAFPELARARIPTLVLRPRRELELAPIAEQLAAAREAGLATYVAENGVHGSSMLAPSRVDGSVEPHWTAVLDSLRTTSKPTVGAAQ